MPALHARGVRRWIVIGPSLALAIGLGGCGATAKGNFVAGANAICASALRETRAIPSPSPAAGAGGQQTGLSGYAGQVLLIVRSEANQFRHLRSSLQRPHDRAALASYLGAVTQTIADYRDLAAAASRNDAQGVASAEAALRASPAPSLAAKYGLRSCATAGATVR